jgi:thiamine biosynthesis lipoprotein
MNQNARKNLIYSIVLLLMVLVVYFFRSMSGPSSTSQNEVGENGLNQVTGEFLAQPYLVLYHSEAAVQKTSFDSILNSLAQQLALTSGSELSQLNQKDTLLNPSKDLVQLLQATQKEHLDSKQAWDPSIAPLQKIWTFSSSGARLQDSVDVAEVLTQVGISKLVVTDTLIRKTKSGLTLDLTDYGRAIALDRISVFLESKGVKNYFLQLGRYTLAKGVNEKEELWKSKVIFPMDSLGAKAEGLVALADRAIATSGDFNTFYTQDSVKKAFQLDPRTGYPVAHGLLAVSVLAPSGKKAGVISEALMVQGWREAMALDSANSEVEMILIYNEKGSGIKLYASPELRKYLSFPVK